MKRAAPGVPWRERGQTPLSSMLCGNEPPVRRTVRSDPDLLATIAVRIGFFVLLMGCQSPEATRVPGQRGADAGNVTGTVELHAGSRMYSRTPCLLPASQCPGPLPVSGLMTDFPRP